MTAKSPIARTAIAAALAVATIGFQVPAASAYSSTVKRACMSDYFAHCSHTKPGTSKLTRCMRKVGPRLSQRCIRALVRAGMVSKTRSRRRAATR